MKPMLAWSSKIRISTFALLVCGGSSIAFSQPQPWYGAINLGSTSAHIDSAALRSALQAVGRTPPVVDVDDKDSGWKLTGGYSFNEWLAVELSYADLGEFVANAPLPVTGVQQAQAEIRGLSVDLVGSVPIGARVSAFGRIGVTNLGVQQDFSNNALGAYFADRTDRGTHEKYGVGAQYAITDAFAARLELERYRTDDNRITQDKASMVSLGLVYRFGPRRAVAPPPVVQQPAAPQRPAPPVTIRLAASALFDFDRSEIKPAGKAELDKLIDGLEGLTYEVILVTGHTDRIGTRAYNLACRSAARPPCGTISSEPGFQARSSGHVGSTATSLSRGQVNARAR
jgi:OOP family OmpA-OmpF porin